MYKSSESNQDIQVSKCENVQMLKCWKQNSANERVLEALLHVIKFASYSKDTFERGNLLLAHSLW